MRAAVRTTGVYLRLIRFEHTLFALPYAVAAALLAAGGLPDAGDGVLILVAMVAARTAAMTFNRLVDRRFDATNPRTATRASVTGEVAPGFLVAATALSAAVFMAAAWGLREPPHPPVAFYLAPAVLAVLLGYSLMKRVSSASHLVLGAALGLAPAGAWVAVRGTLDASLLVPALIGLAVAAWTAGFDVVYACQDVEHDRREGLHAVPARFGVERALIAARFLHAAVPLFLILAGVEAGLGAIWFGTVALVAALLCAEHVILRGARLERLQHAFFTLNVAVAFVVLGGVVLELLVHGAPRS